MVGLHAASALPHQDDELAKEAALDAAATTGETIIVFEVTNEEFGRHHILRSVERHAAAGNVPPENGREIGRAGYCFTTDKAFWGTLQ